MANIQERRDKSGNLISYSIRVHRGRGADGKQLKPWTATFEVSPTWTEKSARKKAEAFAATFEEKCRAGLATDTRQRFDAYCDYVISLKEQRGRKPSTIDRYRELTERIYEEIGHIKLKDLRADHLNTLYSNLSKEGVKKGTVRAQAKPELSAYLKEHKISKARLSARAKIAPSTVAVALQGKSVTMKTAQAITEALGTKLEKIFLIQQGDTTLSAKTVLEYHRLISAVLAQAEKEGLVPFNAAAKATPPSPEKKPPNYFQPETVYAILDAADKEPLKYRAFVYLCVSTGARRGELAGLKWDHIDLDTGIITIEKGLLYSSKRGKYEDSTKTREQRHLKIPQEVVGLLKQLRVSQLENRLKRGECWHDSGYVFTRDDGHPMHPQTWTGWMNDFSIRHDLPHINPHSFRHTAASVLIANHIDIVTTSKLLGHASPDTTAKYYSHMIEAAKVAASDTITDVLIRRKA